MAIDTLGANALASNSVTTAKIAADAVTSAKIPAGAVVVGDIADGSITTAKLADNAVTSAKALNLGRRNLIINGAMQVAQRGTSFTSTADLYTLDRFAIGHGSPVNAMTVSQVTDAPIGFKNSLKVLTGTGASASTGGYAVLRQAIEGQNLYHLNFGTSSAKTITISFYVKSSLTGTFAVTIRNQAGNRAFSATYTISSANTWEYKQISIAGDTGGTWTTSTAIGLQVMFDLGTGSNFDIATGAWTAGSNMFGGESTVKLTATTNATWFLTGLQLEVSSLATDFEHHSVAEELQLCKRYFHTYGGTNAFEHLPFLGQGNGSTINFSHELPVEMRTTPTLTQSGSWQVNDNYLGAYYTLSSITLDNLSTKLVRGSATTSSAIGSDLGRIIAYNDINARWSYSAEL